MSTIYLDNNATTQPAPEVVAAMREMLESHWANPSSIHRAGQSARQRVELARASVAKLIGSHPREVVFTSGGTESDNLALRGILCAPLGKGQGGKRVLITTRIEHSAVREPTQRLGEEAVNIVHLPLAAGGLVEPDALEAALAEHADADVTLVSIQWANNETGAIEPIDELAGVIDRVRSQRAAARAGNAFFHVDGTQAVGKIPVDVTVRPIDLMAFSAHKFHGPKGIGALYIKRGVRLFAQQLGGPQERDLRAGTENTPGIVGIGVAADLARDFIEDPTKIEAGRRVRDAFENAVLEALPDAVVNRPAAEDRRMWNTTNIGFPALEAEAILLGLSEKGVCASAGAACSSGSLEPSPVLRAMGIADRIAHGSVRFSICRETTLDEANRAAAIVAEVVTKLGRTMSAAR